MELAYEVNFDGLVGPTHNYAGLSYGNTASFNYAGEPSSPKQAALEGLAKMKLLMDLGLKQAVLPPQERPDMPWLRRLGFEGGDEAVIEQAYRQSPVVLATCYSASSMWAANAATVSPSVDSADGRVHFTAANLVSQPHRTIEAEHTAAMLRFIFSEETCFAHHEPLPASPHLGDEGAANHTRLSAGHGCPGLELFVYGRVALDGRSLSPQRFPGRQTYEASASVARLHSLDPDRVVFVQQNPEVIDAGVFHNDVIAVGHLNVLVYHRDAFVNTSRTVDALKQKFAEVCSGDLICVEITPEEVSVADAVKTYLFNSQLVTLPDGHMSFICPIDCAEHAGVKAVVDAMVSGANPIGSVHFVDVRQSMQNGGGPACLRLRVVLTESQLGCVHHGVLLDDRLYDRLTAWVHRYYRDELHPSDLGDLKLLDESRAALDELTRLLELGSIYRFQCS